MHHTTLRSAFVAAAIGIAGCNQPEAPPPPPPSTIFIAPTSAPAGSNDLTLTITGHGFANTHHLRSTAVWTMGATTIRLTTTSVSDTQVMAAVPSVLLTAPGTARVHVETVDAQADAPAEKSDEAIFAIVGGRESNTISIIPSSAFEGSSDLTLTIRGSRFSSARFDGSRALWTAYNHTTPLATTFVSHSELTAIVPASLLTTVGYAIVYVVSEDQFPPRNTVPSTFQITAAPKLEFSGVGGAGHTRLLAEEAPRTLGASTPPPPSSSSRPSRRTGVIP